MDSSKGYPTMPGMPEPPPPYSTLPPPPVNPAFAGASGGMYPSTSAPGFNVAGVGTSVVPVMAGSVPPGTHAVVVNVTSSLGSHSQRFVCPSCHQDMVTKTTPTAGLLTWILSGACLVFGCWLGCCLIPCCIRECQDIEHRCSNCKAYIGTYRRI